MVYKKVYSWRAGHGKVSAEDAGKVMEQIEERDGQVTKEAFLEASRPEDSPTHGCFEWDDSIAAEKYRLYQSQKTILDLKVSIETEDGRVRTSAFVNVVPSKDTASYKSTEIAMANTDTRKIVLENAIKDFKSLENKHSHLIELSDIFTAIDTAERRVNEL